jgi:hypothetical protein
MQTTLEPRDTLAGEFARPLTCSSVLAGDTWTEYFRAGSGAPVVLLSREEGVLEGPLFESLAAGFRLIVPVIPEAVLPSTTGERICGAASSEFCAWLRGFLDGLGLVGASVVAAPSLALAALRCALHDAERIGRLVMVLPERSSGDTPAPVIQHRVRTHQPLLLVSGDGSTATEAATPPLLGEINTFLRGALTD